MYGKQHEHRGFAYNISENGRGDLFLDVQAPADEDGRSEGISIPLSMIEKMRAEYLDPHLPGCVCPESPCPKCVGTGAEIGVRDGRPGHTDVEYGV